VLYAFAEGTFSNWTVVYLSEVKQFPAAVGGIALSLFWAALVAGRLGVSALLLRVPARTIWSALPILMIVAFLLLPRVDSAAGGIATFALAGLACSAFFPLTIAIASERFPQHVAWISSMMVAALMAGVGLGSFAVGPLRAWLSMEQLYQTSAAYPAAVLVLVMLIASPRAAARRSPA
jgi:fucose permease